MIIVFTYSPQKEQRLTNIIEELKNYKKQLIEKIEVTKKVGDGTPGIS